MGTRQSIRKAVAEATSVPFEPTFKRQGSPTEAEKALITQFVHDHPGPVTNTQAVALAKAFRRSKNEIKALIEQAQSDFAASVPRYVEIHKQATEKALSHGSMAGLEIAMKGSQWAMERASMAGTRVIEKDTGGPIGPRINIGIKVGGVEQPVESVPLVTVTPVNE